MSAAAASSAAWTPKVQNKPRQEPAWANNPPINGPHKAATPQIIATMAISRVHSRSGKSSWMAT